MPFKNVRRCSVNGPVASALLVSFDEGQAVIGWTKELTISTCSRRQSSGFNELEPVIRCNWPEGPVWAGPASWPPIGERPECAHFRRLIWRECCRCARSAASGRAAARRRRMLNGRTGERRRAPRPGGACMRPVANFVFPPGGAFSVSRKSGRRGRRPVDPERHAAFRPRTRLMVLLRYTRQLRRCR